MSASDPPRYDSKQKNTNDQSNDESQSKDDIQEKKKVFRDSILFKALESAAIHNKDILMGQSDVVSIHEEQVKAASAFRPGVRASAEYDHEEKDVWTPGANKSPRERINTPKGVFTISQNLFHGMADLANINSIEKHIRAMWSKFEATKQKVFREVAAYYFEVYAKMREILHIKSLLKSRSSSLDVAQEMFKTGAAKYLDVAQASAGCAEIQAKLAKANAEYSTLRAKFTELTGFVLPEDLDAPEKLFDDTMKLQQGIDLALKYNPNIIAANDSLLSAKEAVRKPLGKLLPSVDVSYSFERSKMPTSGNIQNRNHKVSLTATFPLYDGGVGRAERRQAIEAASKSAVEKAKIVEETKTEVQSTWANMEASRSNLASSREAVKARELALRDTEEEYRAGLKIMNDVLKAQQELFEAKFLAMNAEKEYFVSQCSANALIGRMNAKFLKFKTPEFDYRSHYTETKRRIF
ncbi:MAG: TolC family protein [Holosporales bacterium]|jgi:outer membrane protein|nr:TolC family protein [Holosporales bacterium]